MTVVRAPRRLPSTRERQAAGKDRRARREQSDSDPGTRQPRPGRRETMPGVTRRTRANLMLLVASAIVMVAGAVNLFGIEGAAQAAAAALVH